MHNCQMDREKYRIYNIYRSSLSIYSRALAIIDYRTEIIAIRDTNVNKSLVYIYINNR